MSECYTTINWCIWSFTHQRPGDLLDWSATCCAAQHTLPSRRGGNFSGICESLWLTFWVCVGVLRPRRTGGACRRGGGGGGTRAASRAAALSISEEPEHSRAVSRRAIWEADKEVKGTVVLCSFTIKRGENRTACDVSRQSAQIANHTQGGLVG